MDCSLETLRKGVDFLGSGLTAIVCIITIVAFLRHRDQLAALWSLLFDNVMDNERIKKIKESLGRLGHLAISKESRDEILSVLGTISGQIRDFAETDHQFNEVYLEIETYITRQKVIKEPEKQKLVATLHVLLDKRGIISTRGIMEAKNERPSS